MSELYTLTNEEIPFLLRQITDPPKKLYIKGRLPNEDTKCLTVVGARKYSSYGEEACKRLIAGLKGYDICIVSGLALGIDSIAHRSAMDVGLQTIAFPGSGLDAKVLYPPTHARLAEEILFAGGAIISEFEMEQEGAPWTFPQRNRLMAGISHATLVIEAELKSGTLITSKFATDYNRDVGAVPGQIFSSLSEGPHMLIGLGAKLIKNSDDILELLGLKTRQELGGKENIQSSLLLGLEENEIKIIELLQVESLNPEQLIVKSHLSARDINQTLSSLEIRDLIMEKNGRFQVK